MSREELMFATLYALGACALLASAWMLHRRWPGRMSIRAAAAMMIAGSFWLGSQVAELALAWASAKWVAAHLQFAGMIAVSSAWFVWVLLYTRHRRWVTRGTLTAMLTIYFLIVLLVITNPYHHLVWHRLAYDRDADLVRQYGAGYWVIWGYLYTTFAVGISLLARKLLRTNRLYRWEISFLMVASVVPWFLGLVDALEELRSEHMQATLASLSVSGILAAWLLFRLRSRHVIPVACQAILDNLADAVVVIDRWGKIIDANAAARRVFGMDASRPANRPLQDYWSNMPPLAHLRSAGDAHEHEIRLETDPDQHVFDLQCSSILDKTGRLISYVIVLRDVTDWKQAEYDRDKYQEELQYAHRLESLAMFAGGMAHEFNNAFTGMLGHTSLALESLPAGAPVVEHLHAVERTVVRASELAAQILAYSGKGHFLVQPVNLSQLLLDYRHVIDTFVDATAHVEWRLDSAMPEIEADSMQMRLMATHLITNASEALSLPDKKITIATGTMKCTQYDLRQAAYFHPDAKAGRYAYVDVTDTGCGMDPWMLGKIFDPFFSTKLTGRGLGLAAVLGIIRGHKGCIYIETHRGAGTSIRVCIPVMPVATTRAPQSTTYTHVALAH